MSENTIIVISEKSCHGFYKTITLKNSSIKAIPFFDAVAFINCNMPDVVILDCGFDVYTGLHLLKKIKSAHSHIPVIFATEISSESIVIEAFRSGARDYLKKPINKINLKKSLEYLSDIKKTSREKRTSFFKSRNVQNENKSAPDLKILPTNFAHVIRFIEDNFSDNISLDELASTASVSKYHFCKLFKKFFGLTPLSYVTMKRVERAKELLPLQSLSISDVSWMVGFNELSSFYKHFKKHTGTTPRQFKSATQREESSEPALQNVLNWRSAKKSS